MTIYKKLVFNPFRGIGSNLISNIYKINTFRYS